MVDKEKLESRIKSGKPIDLKEVGEWIEDATPEESWLLVPMLGVLPRKDKETEEFFRSNAETQMFLMFEADADDILDAF